MNNFIKPGKPFLIILFLVAIFFTAGGQTLPSGFFSTNIAQNWDQPIGAAFNATGTKLFVWEKAGKVFVCNWNSGTGTYDKQTTPVLDISEEVGDWRDHGMLGFALDPGFDVNGKIYVMYVVDRHYLLYFGTGSYDPNANDYFSATIGRITSYTTAMSGSNLLAVTASRKILLGETKSTGIPILHESHGVGSLLFADDGTLIASAGDGATYDAVDNGNYSGTYYLQALADGIIRPNENVGALKSQMINSFNGKILRINPNTGDGVSSNPFYQPGSPRSPQSRVWALGFRNPYRMCLRPGTGSNNPAAGDIGDLYVGDVGWFTYEELNIVTSGGMNCGWPLYEGISPADNLYYDESYNLYNLDEPNPLFGINGCTDPYFTFTDLIKQATADNITAVYNPCNLLLPINGGNSLRTFHRAPVLDWKHYDPIAPDSARVKIFNGNVIDVAQIGSAQSGVTGTPFNGNAASGSCWYTGDMFPANYKNTLFQADFGANWIKNIKVDNTNYVTQVDDFGVNYDNIVSLVQNPMDGSLIAVEIFSPTYGPGSIKQIKYSGNLPPVVVMSSNISYGPSPLPVNFTGSTSYDPEAGPLTYKWDFGDPSSGLNNTSTTANPSHTFTAPTSSPAKYVVKLTVTDDQNNSAADSLVISVNNTPPNVSITSPVNNSHYTLGPDTAYSLTANVTDLEQGPPELFYKWQTFLRHNTHQHAEPIDTNKITSSVISRIGCNGDSYYWFVKLIVTDAAGLSSVDSSKLFPTCSGPLPVNLISLNAETKTDNTNLISWTTASEINLEFFDIERSYDGVQFQKIGTAVARRAPGTGYYEFIDANHSPGYNYYRLKLRDFGGDYKYSLIVRVYSGKWNSNDLLISPNPVTSGFIVVGSNFNKAGKVQIRVLDMNGRVLATQAEQAKQGFNSFKIDNIQQLSAGLYFAEVISEEGRKIKKFVKAN